MGITHCLKRNANESTKYNDPNLHEPTSAESITPIRGLRSPDSENTIIEFFNSASTYWKQKSRNSNSNSSNEVSPNYPRVDICIDQRSNSNSQNKAKKIYSENTQIQQNSEPLESSTKKTGLDEIRDLLVSHVQDSDRMNLVLTLLSETSDHQKPAGKKESMRVIGMMAEIFEDKLANFLPKILQLMSKKLKENDPQIHDTLSASLGNLITFTFRNLDLDTAYKNLNHIFTSLFLLCSKGNRYTQIGAAICITKAIQSSPFELLYVMVDDITLKIIELLRLHTCKAYLQLFECMLSLILSFEGNGEKLEQSAKHMLPVIIDNLTNGDWNVRKIAVEVLYTLSIIGPEVIIPYKHELLDVLGHCRFDKIKNVRDVSLTAIARLKELNNPERPAKLPQAHIEGTEHHENANHYNSKDKRASLDRNLYQISTDLRNSEEDASKWARNSPQQGHLSPTSRLNLKVNPEFFNNAPKHKGDIEIFTKSPPRDFPIDTESLTKPPAPNVPQVQIFTSPDRTFKYTITQPADDFQEDHSGHHHGNNAAHSHGQHGEHLKVSENQEIHSARKFSPLQPKDISVEEIQDEPEVSHKNGRTSHKSSEKKKPASHQKDYPSTSSNRREDMSDENFSMIFRQLDNINKQQSTMMESINNFQNNTHREMDYLKSRVKQLEDFIQKSQQHKPAPVYSYPPNPYAYMPPYQPPFQPPIQHQHQYPVQYANYVHPPPTYYSQSHGHPPARHLEQNYMTRSSVEYSSNQNHPRGHGNDQHQRPLRDHQNNEKHISYQKQTVSHDKMQPEGPRATSSKERQESHHGEFEEHHEPERRRIENETASKVKPRESAGRPTIWERLQEHLNKNEVSAAYELCLNEGDEETLLVLMKETGVIVEYLDSSIVENLLISLKSRFYDESNRDIVIDWMEKALEENINISRGTLIGLHDILAHMIEDGTKMSGLESDKVKRLVNRLREDLDNNNEQNEPQVHPENVIENEDDDMIVDENVVVQTR